MGTPPTVVAEYGQTMKGSIEVAHAQVDAAAKAGAQAYKTQLLNPVTIARRDAGTYWEHGRQVSGQQEAFGRAGLIDYRAWDDVAAHAWAEGLSFVATPFDLPAVDRLYAMRSDVVMKVASGDLTNVPLLRAVAQASGSRIIIVSTGAARSSEVQDARDVIADAGNAGLRVFWLACTLAYPTAPQDANLRRMETLRTVCETDLVGYSDHVGSDMSAACATALGARCLEVHTTLDPGEITDCPDDVHALGPLALRRYVDAAAKAASMLGDPVLEPCAAEAPARAAARRSICAVRNLSAGTVLRAEDLTCLRPGDGIDPRRWDDVIGCMVTTDVWANSAIPEGALARRGPEPLR
ncbi:MAG: N-acetylneuraminate synthase family protein [Baekduiaceae bacterium]